jgi:hypothetical protein
MVGPFVVPVFLARVTASRAVGAAVVILVESAGETIVIAAPVFLGTRDGRLRRERQNEGARGDGDRELQRLLLLVLLRHEASGARKEEAQVAEFEGPSCRNFSRGAKPSLLPHSRQGAHALG